MAVATQFMDFGHSLPAFASPTEEVWQEIEAVLEGLADLARSDVAPAELHGRFLERLVGLLSAAGGVVWNIASDRPPSVECQLHLDQALAGDRQELARHQRLAEAVAASSQPRLVPPAYRDGHQANASPWLSILCPVTLDGRPLLVIELFVQPDGRTTTQEGYLRLVRTTC